MTADRPAATTVTPGDRYYAARAVHLGAVDGRALCGASLLAGIDTTAALTCEACGTTALERSGLPAAQARQATRELVGILRDRAAAEAPALELPGVTTADVVELALGGRDR